jgi:hypothetical protein
MRTGPRQDGKPGLDLEFMVISMSNPRATRSRSEPSDEPLPSLWERSLYLLSEVFLLTLLLPTLQLLFHV